jgi:hypothetical protein
MLTEAQLDPSARRGTRGISALSVALNIERTSITVGRHLGVGVRPHLGILPIKVLEPVDPRPARLTHLADQAEPSMPSLARVREALCIRSRVHTYVRASACMRTYLPAYDLRICACESYAYSARRAEDREFSPFCSKVQAQCFFRNPNAGTSIQPW